MGIFVWHSDDGCLYRRAQTIMGSVILYRMGLSGIKKADEDEPVNKSYQWILFSGIVGIDV